MPVSNNRVHFEINLSDESSDGDNSSGLSSDNEMVTAKKVVLDPEVDSGDEDYAKSGDEEDPRPTGKSALMLM